MHYQRALEWYDKEYLPNYEPQEGVHKIGRPLPLTHLFKGNVPFEATLLLVAQEGDTRKYRFNISRAGVHTIVDNFTYSGEAFKLVARGIDWYAAITSLPLNANP